MGFLPVGKELEDRGRGRETDRLSGSPSPPVFRAFLQVTPQTCPRAQEDRIFNSYWLLKGRRTCRAVG